jgi:hypothetical protein
MRTATSNRPFNIVTDKYYRTEVELLRPGTIIPSPSTVSRNLKLLYLVFYRPTKLGFMQHYTGDQTFRSSMALGSWDALFPHIGPAIEALQRAMDGG